MEKKILSIHPIYIFFLEVYCFDFVSYDGNKNFIHDTKVYYSSVQYI